MTMAFAYGKNSYHLCYFFPCLSIIFLTPTRKDFLHGSFLTFVDLPVPAPLEPRLEATSKVVLELLLEFVLEKCKGKRMHFLPPGTSVLGQRGKQTVHKIGFTTKTDGRTDGWKGPAGPTHVAEEVDERVHAGVAHRQPVRAEPDDVDVLEAAKKNQFMSRTLSHVLFKGKGPTHLLTCGAMTESTW